MTTEQIDQLIKINFSKIAPEQEEAVRQCLVGADEVKAQTAFAELKSPTTVLLVSIFLGALGIDRFMLGQRVMGLLKLVTGGGCGLWTVIDWFTAGDRTRAYNTRRILADSKLQEPAATPFTDEAGEDEIVFPEALAEQDMAPKSTTDGENNIGD